MGSVNGAELPDDQRRELLSTIGHATLSSIVSSMLGEDPRIEGVRIQLVVGLGDMSAAFGTGYDMDDEEDKEAALHDAMCLLKAAAEEADYNLRQTFIPGGFEALFKPGGQG